MKTTFGKFIRQIRINKNLTQAECATALGFAHRSGFHRLETGQREWTLRNITDFAGLLGLTPGKLLMAYELRG